MRQLTDQHALDPDIIVVTYSLQSEIAEPGFRLFPTDCDPGIPCAITESVCRWSPNVTGIRYRMLLTDLGSLLD